MQHQSKTKPRSGTFIQARSNSSRLPGKIFEGLPKPGDKALILHVYERMLQAGSGVVALLIPDTDHRLKDFCQEHRLEHFAGSELDVRSRYREAALHYDVAYIVRATGDNPCTDCKLAGSTLEKLIHSGADLCSFEGLPLGTGVEAFRTDALMRDAPVENDDYREHVSLHIKYHPELFRILRLPSPFGVVPPLRLTVDEAKDLDVVRRIFARLGDDFGIPEILELSQLDPGIFEGNRDVKQVVPGKAG